MQSNFAFDVEPDRNLVRIWLGGFFSPADVAGFANERDRAHQRLRCGPNEHVTLVDIREMAIQPQDSVAAFRQMLSNPAMISHRLAFIVAFACQNADQARRGITGRRLLRDGRGRRTLALERRCLEF